MIEIYDNILREELAKIPPLTRQTYLLTDSIAARIDAIMKTKGMSKKQLAELTHKRPSEVTKWLAGGHNFTCKTLVLISNALGEDLVQVTH
ncbi:MAG: helix-turn-helix transcriptional regulator [Bacteroidales bacterium]|nr:helix-turn-helix transcriptional regulator [Bacteroidales bacterium]